MMTSRTRTRRPDNAVAKDNDIEVSEQIEIDTPPVDGVEDTSITEHENFEEGATTFEEAIRLDTPAKAVLQGPFTVNGFYILDAKGRKIAMCGVYGDIARTGPGIAEALVELLNKA